MTIALTSEAALAMEVLRTALANSAAFQAWVEAADASEALASIHYVNEKTGSRPLAIISNPQLFAVAAGGFQRYTVMISFEAVPTKVYSEEDAVIEFINTVGDIVQEMQQYDDANAQLIAEFEAQDQPQRTREEQGQDFMYQTWRIRTGIDMT